ncbi:hypothetical protein ACFOZ0_02245 [Streptomyces yaanensis]|uniref:LacI family transcriptional regulator n=1 Tax=Streptomyces yaanensis TaxID=1142239 RepID=A0ABV7S9L2_9ACTN|nr:hypothetical protein [Streptomyces sp. CGMCC 4.7035]WNB99706.1 hypothetical protein Q2K21_17460 [Streptomyces sp. CGMCC 4.7035]
MSVAARRRGGPPSVPAQKGADLDQEERADARAKAVAGVATPTLAFVLDDITGPSFTHMAHGVEREATRLGHLCLVCSTDGDPEHQLDFIEMMRAQRTKAVILVGGTADTHENRDRTARIADSLRASRSAASSGRAPAAGCSAWWSATRRAPARSRSSTWNRAIRSRWA